MRSRPSPLAIWAGILVLYVVWGSTYLGMKLAIDSMPPFVMGAFRFVPAGLLLAALVVARDRAAIRRPTRRQAVDTTIVGVLMLVGGTGLVAWGEQTIPTGVAALMIAVIPMWLAVFGRVLFGDRIPALAAVGIAVGLAGVGILAWPTGEVGGLDPAGLAALLVSPVCWTLGTFYAMKRASLPSPALFSTALQMLAGGLGAVVAAALTGELATFDVGAVTATSWIGIAYLVVAGSLVGFTTYAWLLTVAPVARVATYAYVNPVVAVVLGWIFLGEPLTPRTAVASVVIVGAVALIVTARGRATHIPRDPEAAPDATPAPAPGAPAVPATGAGTEPAERAANP